jgi:integrase
MISDAKPARSETKLPRLPAGCRWKHSRACGSRSGGACSCKPSIEVRVWSPRDAKHVGRSFRTVAAAKAWLHDTQSAMHRGTIRASQSVTVRDAADALVAGMKDGSVRDRSGRVYKHSTIRAYDAALRLYVLPAVGGRKLQAVRRSDVLDLVADWRRAGAKNQTIRNRVMPLAVIFRRAIDAEVATVNPTGSLRLGAAGTRDRVESPETIAATLACLPGDLRGIYATAFYAGLRRGEIRGLHWSDVDLDANTIRVSRSWDDKEGVTTPKSRAGMRVVPILDPLRVILAEHKLRYQTRGDLVFASIHGRPFTPSVVRRRAEKTMKTAGFDPISLHELRHSGLSMFAASNPDQKVVQGIAGHADSRTTSDVYVKALPGSLDDARRRANARLANGTV